MAYYNNKKYDRPKKYTFFSDGNGYDFYPERTTSYNGKLTTMLDIHVHEVKHRRSKRCFILDETGKVYRAQ